MTHTLDNLKSYLAEIADLQHIFSVLEWDMQTYMPPRGTAERGEQMATVQKLAHDRLVADRLGELLEAAAGERAGADPDGDEARLLAVTARRRRRALALPGELVGELARTTSVAHAAWAEAREQKNFERFQPDLERIFDLKRQQAACYGPQESVYDPLLDEFEPDMKASDLRALFGGLKPALVALARAIAEQPETDDAVLRRDYDEAQQLAFGRAVVAHMGYDFQRGRVDTVLHPFQTTFGLDDVRITTRIHRNFLSAALMGCIHETGHALYEQGFDRAFARTPLADSTSLGIHESQSRLWENVVGRSRGFWRCFYPRLQEAFPANLADVDPEVFYRAINKVKPSFIRVEADEVTYNLHILLRFELELDVLEGRLAVKDLPAAWNARFRDDFGLEVPDDSLGVLQDVHWSAGYVGYFPTYTLGNLASVQLYEQAVRDIPAIPAGIGRGEFGELLGWLRQHIHRHGSKFSAPELLQRATGRPLDAQPYLDYLRRKYGELYGLPA